MSLFTGIGGIDIALEEWVTPYMYCEKDTFAQSVLQARMQSGDLPTATIWEDVQTLHGSIIPEGIDIIYGGFPCQDISIANPTGAGLGGKRSGLFYEIVRLAKETGAPFIFLENVPAIRTRGLREVIAALTELRYDCRWTVVSANEVGAPHVRKRWFLLAHKTNVSNPNGFSRRLQQNIRQERECHKEATITGNDCNSQSLAHQKCKPDSRPTRTSWWEVEPGICRVADALPNRMDRLRSLGNAVVPAQGREAFMKLLGLKHK